MKAPRVLSVYPAECEEWVTLRNGERVFLRPIEPTDGPKIDSLTARVKFDGENYGFKPIVFRSYPFQGPEVPL